MGSRTRARWGSNVTRLNSLDGHNDRGEDTEEDSDGGSKDERVTKQEGCDVL